MSTPLREILSRTLGGFNEASEDEKEEMIRGFMEDKEAHTKIFGQAVGGWNNFSPEEREEVSSGIFREDREVRQKSFEEQQRIAAEDAGREYPLEKAGEAVRDLRPLDAAGNIAQWGATAVARGVAGFVPKVQKAIGFAERTVGSIAGSPEWDQSGQDWNKTADETQQAIDKALPPGAPRMADTGIGLDTLPLNIVQGVDTAAEFLPELGVIKGVTIGLKAAGMGAEAAGIVGPAAVVAPRSIPQTADVIEQATGKFAPGTAIVAGTADALLWSLAMQRLLQGGVQEDAAKRILGEMAQKGQWGRIAQIGKEAVRGSAREAAKMGLEETGSGLIEQTAVMAEGGPTPSLSKAVMEHGLPGALTAGALGFVGGMGEGSDVHRRYNMKALPRMTPEAAKSFAESVFVKPQGELVTEQEKREQETKQVADLAEESRVRFEELKFERERVVEEIAKQKELGREAVELEAALTEIDAESRIMQDNVSRAANTNPDRQMMVEENPNQKYRDQAYLKNEDGSFDFGRISEDIAKEAGMFSVPIRLRAGVQDMTKPAGTKGAGELHIGVEHAAQILRAGFKSVEEFVSYITTNFNQIRAGKKGRQALIVSNGDSKVGFIELSPQRDFYEVISARIQDRPFDGELLWEQRAKTTREPGSPVSLVDSPDKNPDTGGQRAPESQSNSNQNISQPDPGVKPPDGKQFFDQSTGTLDRRDLTQTPTDPNITAPVKRSEIFQMIKKIIFGFQGGLNAPKRVLGWYDRAKGIFRVQDAKDIEVDAHELGHGLAQKMGLSDVELQPFAAELAPIASPGKPLQEGFAEFLRYYVTDPAKATQVAPKFLGEFQRRLGHYKEFGDALHEIRGAWENYARQSPELRLLSNVDLFKPETFTEKISRFFHDVGKSYSWFVDETDPMRKMELLMNGGKELPIWQSPQKLMRLFRGAEGKAASFIDYKPMEFFVRADRIGKPIQFINNAKSFREIMAPVEAAGKSIEIRSFLLAKHAKEIFERDRVRLNKLKKEVATRKRPKSDLDNFQPVKTGLLESDVDFVLNKYKDDAVLNQAANDFYAYQGHVLKYAMDAGLLSASDYARMRPAHKNYIPIHRVMGEVGAEQTGFELVGGGTGQGFEVRGKVTKDLRGSGRDIIDPLESIVKNTYAFVTMAEKNAVGQAIARLANTREGIGALAHKIKNPTEQIRVKLEDIKRQLAPSVVHAIEKLPQDLQDKTLLLFRAGQIPKDNVISVWNKGKMELYQVDPEIATAMKGLDRESSNIFMRMLATPAGWLRAGATLTPEFMGANPVIDQFGAAIFSKYQFVPFVDWGRALFKGISSTWKKDLYYQKWLASGGGGAELVSLNRKSLYAELQRALNNPQGLAKYTRLVTNPIESLEAMSKFTEQITRLGEFRLGLEAEGDTAGGAMNAALAARDVSLDFRRMGAKMKGLNQITAFLNAAVQGTDKAINGSVQQFRTNPALFSARIGAYLVLPTLYLWAANKDDPRYQAVEQVVKDTHWIFIPGAHVTQAEWDAMSIEQKVELTKNSVWRIPKPRELGILFSSFFERTLQSLYEKDPHAFDDFDESLSSAFTPRLLPTAVAPVAENILNKSFWTNRDLEPMSVQRRRPEARYTNATSEVEKAAGMAAGVSPIKIGNVGRGYLGGAYKYGVDLADKVGELVGVLPEKSKPESLYADVPGVRRFAHRSMARSEYERRFDAQFRDADQRYNTIKFYLEQGKISEANALRADGVFVKLTEVRQKINAFNDKIQAINDDKTMDPVKKSNEILKYQVLRNDVAKQGTEIYDRLIGLFNK